MAALTVIGVNLMTYLDKRRDDKLKKKLNKLWHNFVYFWFVPHQSRHRLSRLAPDWSKYCAAKRFTDVIWTKKAATARKGINLHNGDTILTTETGVAVALQSRFLSGRCGKILSCGSKKPIWARCTDVETCRSCDFGFIQKRHCARYPHAATVWPFQKRQLPILRRSKRRYGNQCRGVANWLYWWTRRELRRLKRQEK